MSYSLSHCQASFRFVRTDMRILLVEMVGVEPTDRNTRQCVASPYKALRSANRTLLNAFHLLAWQRVQGSNLYRRSQSALSYQLDEPAILN